MIVLYINCQSWPQDRPVRSPAAIARLSNQECGFALFLESYQSLMLAFHLTSFQVCLKAYEVWGVKLTYRQVEVLFCCYPSDPLYHFPAGAVAEYRRSNLPT
eukprot:1157227-Pelagomonas_calceolata.AAC.2